MQAFYEYDVSIQSDEYLPLYFLQMIEMHSICQSVSRLDTVTVVVNGGGEAAANGKGGGQQRRNF